MITARFIETIDVANVLGEGVLWRASDETLWWTDIQAKELYCLDWRTQEIKVFSTPERLGSFGFVDGHDDFLIAAFETGFALYHPGRGATHWLARPPELSDGVRLNDGRVDPFGRFWAGSMIERKLGENETPDGRLYTVDALGKSHVRARGVHIANGLCWSPAEDRIYFSDSMKGEIRSAPHDATSMDALPLTTFATTTDGAPDGAVTDYDGRYWSALWGASRVACYSPGGEEVFSLPIDAPQPTCPAFGGAGGNLLFVTSARDGLSEAALSASPKSGAVFVFETNLSGAPAQRAKLAPALIASAGFAK